MISINFRNVDIVHVYRSNNIALISNLNRTDFFSFRRNATFVRTHRHAAVVGWGRAVQPNAAGRSQHRLFQTPHDQHNRRHKTV